MTADRRAALITAMNQVYWKADRGDRMGAVLDLIRAETLEEAAVACENIYGEEGCACNDWPTPEQCAAAIRVLKGSDNGR